MPIVQVEIVLHEKESLRATLATELADRIGETLKSAPGGTWVKVDAIPAHHYAENNTESGEAAPVFVSILKAKMPATKELQREVTVLTTVIAQVCERSQQSVHIIYQPDGGGRIAFGGSLMTG